MKTPDIVLYGIPNCDTVRKARAWCDAHGVAYRFHDFKKSGVPADELRGWLRALGPAALVNKRGTTWRQLDEATQAAVADEGRVADILQKNPSLIKRPVVDWGGDAQLRLTVGFDEAMWIRQSDAHPGSA